MQLAKQHTSGLGLEIAYGALRLVELVEKEGKVYLSKVQIQEIEDAQNPLPAEKSDRMVEAIKQIFQSAKVTSKSCVSAISGNSAFIRFIKMLPVSHASLDQAVSYEVQQQIPFSVQEILWDYQLLSADEETGQGLPPRDSLNQLNKKDVLLVAAKKANIKILEQLFAKAKIHCQAIEVDTLAFYNCLLFNYDFLAGKHYLILDVKNNSVDMLILRDKTFWTRSFPFDNLKLAKHDLGASPSSLFEPLLEELTRSLNYYFNQGGKPTAQSVESQAIDYSLTPSSGEGYQLKEIIVSGENSEIEGLNGALEEFFHCPVSGFEPLKKIVIDKNENLVKDLSGKEKYLPSAIGLALQGLKLAALKINLLRETKQKNALEIRKRFYEVGIWAMSVAIILSGSMPNWFKYERKLQTLKKLEALKEEMGQYKDKVDKTSLVCQSLEKKSRELVRISKNRSCALELLNNLNKFLEPYIWLEQVSSTFPLEAPLAKEKDSPFTAAKVKLRGKAMSYEAVNQFISDLKNFPQFSDVKPLSSGFVQSENKEKKEEMVEFSIAFEVLGSIK